MSFESSQNFFKSKALRSFCVSFILILKKAFKSLIKLYGKSFQKNFWEEDKICWKAFLGKLLNVFWESFQNLFWESFQKLLKVLNKKNVFISDQVYLFLAKNYTLVMLKSSRTGGLISKLFSNKRKLKKHLAIPRRGLNCF